MDASTMAAWWGAISGTLVLVWEIFRWGRSGPRVRVTASPNMKLMTPGVGIDKKTYISVDAVNVGDSPTTLTHFCACTYKNWFDRARGKKSQLFVISPGPESPIPYKLQVGERWSALTDQSRAVASAQGELFYIGVQHVLASKPIYVRVTFNSAG
jgi:hypothetical protein